MSSCDTYTGSGAYMGGSIGSILGSAIGGLSGGPRGSDMGTIIGMAGGAAVGAVIGSQADQRQQQQVEQYQRATPVELREGLLGLSSKTPLVSLAMISQVMVSEVTISQFMVRRIVRIFMSSILPIVVMTVFTILMVKIMCAITAHSNRRL